jgi:pyridoxamine 5'-phosphate oxidase
VSVQDTEAFHQPQTPIMSDDIYKALRQDYKVGQLDENSVSSNPFELFTSWFEFAVSSKIPEANACSVATVSSDGRPSSRMVLLKQFDERGFVFFTNYGSRKGNESAQSSNVAMLFFWQPLERQIRIEGCAQRIAEAESDAYFQSRPRSAQIGAVVSQQSQVASSRAEIDEAVRKYAAQSDGSVISRPDNWGGLRVVPTYFEFWQGRESRIHDRIVFSLKNNTWERSRLWP